MSRPSTTPIGRRRKIWIAPSVLMLGLFFSFYAFAFAQACTIGNVIGFVDCIVKSSGTNYTAYFGYTNNDSNLTVKIKEDVGHYNEIRDVKTGNVIPDLKPVTIFNPPKSNKPGDNQTHFAFSVTFDAAKYTSGIEWSEGLLQPGNYSSGQHQIVATPTAGSSCSPAISANVVTPLSPPITPAVAHVGQLVTFNAHVTLNAPQGSTLPSLESNGGGVVFTIDQQTTLPGTYIGNDTWKLATTTLSSSDTPHSVVATYGSQKYANVSATVNATVTGLSNFVSCVDHNTNGTYTAYFGYQNNDVITVQDTIIPVNNGSVAGSVRNDLYPALAAPGQTTVFVHGTPATTTKQAQPMNVQKAFSVVFNGSNLVWNLAGHTATASSASPVCTPYQTATIVTSLTPSTVGQSVTFTANVTAASAPSNSAAPTGTVNFTDENNTNLGTATLDGTDHAALTTLSLLAGTHTITATYIPVSNSLYPTSHGTTPQVVNKIATSTAVTSSVNPSTVGQNVTFTATVIPAITTSGTPSGTIQFFDGTTSLGTGTLVGGKTTISTASLTQGTHNIQTTYAGDATFTGSAGNTSQTVSAVVVVQTTPTPGPTTPTPTVAPVATIPAVANNNSYFRIVESSSAFTSVNVAVDSANTFPNVASCTVQAYTPITAGNHTFAVTGSSASITKSISLTAGNYYTLVIVGGGASATAQDLIVIQDDLTIIAGQAKVRVYHFADGVGPVSVAANGAVVVPTLAFETASSYLTQTPGTVTYTITLLNTPSTQLTDAMNESANGVYSIFTLCSNKTTNAATAGLPSALPQTGADYTPASSINWSQVIVLMNILLLIGAGIGGVAGFTVLRYRQTHR